MHRTRRRERLSLECVSRKPYQAEVGHLPGFIRAYHPSFTDSGLGTFRRVEIALNPLFTGQSKARISVQ